MSRAVIINLILLVLLGLLVAAIASGFNLLAGAPAGASTDNKTVWQPGDTIEPMPIYSMKPKLDCDDSAIYMYLWLTSVGYQAKIIWGNLEKTGEWEGNHYWVIAVSDNGTEYPYDFGYYLPDEQHFEGRVVSYKSLLYWAGVDQR